MRGSNVVFAALTVLFCVYVVTAAFWSRGESIRPRPEQRRGRATK